MSKNSESNFVVFQKSRSIYWYVLLVPNLVVLEIIKSFKSALITKCLTCGNFCDEFVITMILKFLQ